MRIQHNIMAMSAYRNYTNNVSAMKKNLEKLSSGYKINRAGDDAAGLAISEKMRAQITGLETAQKNAKDGISLVQTAEGALTEVHDMLNRMVELATQSANGTYDSDTDRLQLQKEMNQLREEIDRIADSSNFNGIKLLDGTMDAGGGTTQASIVLPEDSATQFGNIGDKTILKGAGKAAQGTVFGVQFDNLAIDAKAGDKLTVQIGATAAEAIVIDLDAKKYSASDLADELVKACTNSETTIGGQTFTVAKGADGTSVTFTQKEVPTGTTDTVEASMDVKMSYTPTGGTATVLNDGIATHDGGYVVYDATPAEIAGTANSSISLDENDSGKTVDASSLNKTAILAALGDNVPDDGAKVTIEKNSDNKLELKVGDTVVGTSTAAVPDSSDAATTITFTASGNAVGEDDPSLGTIELASGVTASDITAAFETGLTYAAAKTDDSNGGDDPPASTPVNKEIFSQSDGVDVTGGNLDKTLNDLSLTTLFSGLSDVAAGDNNDISVKLSELTFDSTDTLQAALKKISDAFDAAVTKWNTDNADAAYHYEYNGLSTDGTENGKIDLQAATGVTALINKVTGQADPPSTGSGVSGSYNAATVKITQGNAVVADQRASTTIDLSDIFGGDIGDGSTLTIGENTYTFKWGDSNSFTGTTITLDKNASAAERINYAAKAMSNMDNSAFSIGNETTGGKITIDEKAGNTKYTTELSTHAGFESLFSAKKVTAEDTTKGLKLQIGDTADSYNQLRVSIGDTHCSALGLDTISIEDQDKAASAIDTIKKAINTVSDIRGTLGATQNRLDHTINNLSVMTENIQDAESTIRDVDVAEEMMAYTKNNILIQSAQAMLAQANQVPQGVLQLLQ